MTPLILEEWRAFSPRSAEQRESGGVAAVAGRSRWLRNGFKVPRELSAREVTRARCASPRGTGRSKHLHKASPSRCDTSGRKEKCVYLASWRRKKKEEEEEEETTEELFALAKSTDAEETRLSEKASESTRKTPGHELRHEEKGITIELSRGFASLVVASLDDARTHARIVFHRVRLQLVALARSLYTRSLFFLFFSCSSSSSFSCHLALVALFHAHVAPPKSESRRTNVDGRGEITGGRASGGTGLGG